MSTQSTLVTLYQFELDNLKKEIMAYTHEQHIWEKREGIGNSGGHLCLHLTGSIQHFIGATLGHTGYVRNREAEFTAEPVSREHLLSEITKAKEVAGQVIGALTDAQLNEFFPFDFMGKQPVSFYLTRFLAHLSYHLGQINYHRRLV